jgi:hypothetical protein
MDLLQSPYLLAAVCAFFFWGADAHEARSGGENHGALWAVLSILASTLMILGFHAATMGWLLLAQGGLFLGIGLFRAWREP